MEELSKDFFLNYLLNVKKRLKERELNWSKLDEEVFQKLYNSVKKGE